MTHPQTDALKDLLERVEAGEYERPNGETKRYMAFFDAFNAAGGESCRISCRSCPRMADRYPPRPDRRHGGAVMWTHVMDKMPPKNTRVLTCWLGDAMLNPVIVINEWRTQIGSGWWHSRPNQVPTHWMQLPPPPTPQETP